MDSDNKRSQEQGRPMHVGVVGDENHPPGEDQGLNTEFTASAVAEAFGVDIDRVYKAMQGEFGLDERGTVDSRQAQHLAEVILGDQPMDQQEAALMQLGAYTPRADTIEATATEKPAGELSDRLRSTEEAPEFGAPEEPGE